MEDVCGGVKDECHWSTFSLNSSVHSNIGVCVCVCVCVMGLCVNHPCCSTE